MYPWKCCRTCLSEEALQPIFPSSENCDKFSKALYKAVGIKVETNDSLPQTMCVTCINIVNETNKFRKKCSDAQKILNERINIIDNANINFEVVKLETDGSVTINIENEFSDSEFKDYEDNISLDAPQCNDIKIDKSCLNMNKEEFDEKTSDTKVSNVLKCSKVNGEVKAGIRKKKSKSEGDKSKEEIECEYCHKVLTSKLSLRNHYKIHTGFDVVCEHCGKKFITRRLLLMHCRAKHGYEKTDKCSYCEYKASNAEQVKIHERLHTGEKPYACKECEASFHRKSSYLQHIAIHLPEKTVQCEQCPARFKSTTLMRIHASRHRAPTYSFLCGVCGNSFARRRNVTRHLLRTHGMSDQGNIQRVRRERQ